MKAMVSPPGPEDAMANCYTNNDAYWSIGGKICIHKCAVRGQTIFCTFVYARSAKGVDKYDVSNIDKKFVELFDNFGVSHPPDTSVFREPSRSSRSIHDVGDGGFHG